LGGLQFQSSPDQKKEKKEENKKAKLARPHLNGKNIWRWCCAPVIPVARFRGGGA
jgi:hypothetical protein